MSPRSSRSTKVWAIFLTASFTQAFFCVAQPTFAADTKKKKEEPPIPVLPLSIAIAMDKGKAVRDEPWIDAQLGEVERLFGPIGVSFQKGALRPLDERYARLETRRDRDALAAEIKPGVINVFVVSSLRDVDDPSRYRMGVHWRKSSDTKKHYVILSSSAVTSVLAHELGHFFGNGHTKAVNNLMSYIRLGPFIYLSPQQAARIQLFARNYVRAKELLPALGGSAPTSP